MEKSLSIKWTEFLGLDILELSGFLTAGTVDKLKRFTKTHLSYRGARIAIALDVREIDSAGFGWFVGLVKQLEYSSGDACVYAMSEYVKEVSASLNLQGVLRFVEGLAGALEYFSVAAGEDARRIITIKNFLDSGDFEKALEETEKLSHTVLREYFRAISRHGLGRHRECLISMVALNDTGEPFEELLGMAVFSARAAGEKLLQEFFELKRFLIYEVNSLGHVTSLFAPRLEKIQEAYGRKSIEECVLINPGRRTKEQLSVLMAPCLTPVMEELIASLENEDVWKSTFLLFKLGLSSDVIPWLPKLEKYICSTFSTMPPFWKMAAIFLLIRSKNSSVLEPLFSEYESESPVIKRALTELASQFEIEEDLKTRLASEPAVLFELVSSPAGGAFIKKVEDSALERKELFEEAVDALRNIRTMTAVDTLERIKDRLMVAEEDDERLELLFSKLGVEEKTGLKKILSFFGLGGSVKTLERKEREGVFLCVTVEGFTALGMTARCARGLPQGLRAKKLFEEIAALTRGYLTCCSDTGAFFVFHDYEKAFSACSFFKKRLELINSKERSLKEKIFFYAGIAAGKAIFTGREPFGGSALEAVMLVNLRIKNTFLVSGSLQKNLPKQKFDIQPLHEFGEDIFRLNL